LQFSRQDGFDTVCPMLRSGLSNVTGIIASLFCAVLFTAIRGNGADVSGLRYGPPDNWVKPHFFGQLPAIDSDSGIDQRVLLWEQQINAASNETFIHSIRQIVSTAGVQKGATISIDYNPSCEYLTFHWARIWRDGQHLERLDTNEVKVVQPEHDLDQYILNGQKTAILVLDDVRVGDIIDYSYSIQGANPIFASHFSAEVPVQLGEPAERLLTSVLWPKQKTLYAQPHGCSVRPEVIAVTNGVEYVWDSQDIPAVSIEDSLPGWYDPEPWVQLTDFASWAEVNRWALSLFQVTSPLSPDLARQIAEWRQYPDQEQQILSALRFVQDEVRYFGIEIGESSEKPADPSMVFSRRYGDCKDKALLFVTILRALGIEAYPALVNSTLGHSLDDWQPSADAFDHCIAVVRCNGQVYWLDPTISYQRGSLATHYLPPYERALVITPGTMSLATIPQAMNISQTSITEYFQMGGKNDPAGLKIVTIADGRDADSLREYFATTKRDDIGKHYTRFYANLYPGITMSSPISIQDDEGQNEIQTTEFYSIDKAWTRSDSGDYQCSFYPETIAAFLSKPEDTDRTMPLGMSYPEHQILRTEVALPRAWQFDTVGKSVSDPAFTFKKNCWMDSGKLVMQYEYQSLSDSVPPEQISQYLQDVDESAQSLGYTLTWPNPLQGKAGVIGY